MTALYDRACGAIRGIYDRRISGPPILDMDTFFPAGQQFAGAWEAIREEALAAAARLHAIPRFHEIMHEQESISANDNRDWRMLILKAYGIDFPRNAAACPLLASIVDSLPEVVSASVSFLAPRKHIPPHRGPFRGVLRYYLGLVMPRTSEGELAAVLKIAGQPHRLAEGESLLWDDTYMHEVWNASDQVRIVLLLDVWRRDMPPDMELFSHLLASLIRTGIRARRVAQQFDA